jgi:ATP-dependent DNA ligase
MMRSLTGRRRVEATALPDWIKPQLTKLVDKPPKGPEWLHEIKFDGYWMHARLDRGAVRLLTRTGLDWTHKYPAIASAVSALGFKQAYLDGELCGVRPDGTSSFSLIQAASDSGNADTLIVFLFDLLYLEREAISSTPLLERKERLRELCRMQARRRNTAIIRLDAARNSMPGPASCRSRGSSQSARLLLTRPGNRGLWVKPPPRTSKFGFPLVLSRVHWVRPELVAGCHRSRSGI